MNILLTGGTGFVGSSVLRHLIDRGHAVTAIVRSNQSAAAVAAAGATAVLGDLTNVDWLTEQLRGVDGAIHAATPSDSPASQFDTAVATAVVRAFSGTGKPYIHTGGIWAYGSGADITEESTKNPPAIVAWRGAVESIVLDADVATTVLEPAVVYGHGKGIPNVITSAPRTASGELTLVGSGDQHWATVHVDDLGALYALVIEGGTGLGYLIGSGGVSPTVRELGLAATRDAAVASSTDDETRNRLGAAFADALLLDQQASGAKARSLGWTPVGRTLVDELAATALPPVE